MVRLYRGQVPTLSSEIIRTLRAGGEIEVESARVIEAEKDLAAVLDEFIRTDMAVLNEAKDILAMRREPRSNMGRIRREVAARYNHQLGDEGMSWVQHQLIECILATNNIEEIYADDATLLRIIRESFDKVLVSEDALHEEVRSRMKNLKEGTPAYEVQYQKTMRDIRRKHGLTRRTEEEYNAGRK